MYAVSWMMKQEMETDRKVNLKNCGVGVLLIAA